MAVIDETERLLRDARYLYDVQIRPVAYQDGVVDIEVLTRDSWSLIPGVSAARAGGENSTGIRLREYNLLGTGTTLGIGHSSDVDRSSNELLLSNDRVFGTWTAVSLSLARNSDGERYAASVVRPFYSLDARWAAGATAVKDNRIDAVYNAGNVVSEYRHRQEQAEVFAGWSRGRVDGWVQRYSIGVSLLDDAFAPEPGRTAPAALNADERLVGPFVRYELIEDRYAKVINRDMIGIPEFFALGLASTLQLGWASTGLGSSHDALLYQASVSRGFEPSPEHTLLASASISGQYTDGRVRKQLFGVEGKYYLPQGGRWLFYAAASGDMLTNPDVLDMLLLGGDNGLRGYPLRYQAGDKRVLLTLEERVYSDAVRLEPVPRGRRRVRRRRPRLGRPAREHRQSRLARRCRRRPAHLQRARVDEGRAAHRRRLPAQRHPRHQEGAVAGQGQDELLKPGSPHLEGWPADRQPR